MPSKINRIDQFIIPTQKHIRENKFKNEYTECPYDHTPNAKTRKTIQDAKKGIGIHHAKDAYDLLEQCGIKIKNSKK